MIKEDYVCFGIAKLLKEKGFNEPCRSYWADNHSFSFEHTKLFVSNGDDSVYILRPTLQMAMKWLREVHKLYIEITPSSKTNEFIVDSYRIDIVTKTFDTIYVSSGYDTYEEACEAAIKYCLENLI